ncbi:extracellular solute-binding protein, family 3 [Indibacter alkaliphilus LW1]|uniref:Extracellular solute-binding protein, family 3 n=1 Tax=Indibacter alkaliphilus (strain CCUG 57479 / KCTC 22604 / LW1) TaxID=1189612 RepID=S2CYN9_INDAL|nr:transporter substrate-binding domain-containing protein [Indibacter alkaliphilus]EOZ92277.1 extracellular solute-binding protein, family 3 [Indibacter alkaliphilus LW1]
MRKTLFTITYLLIFTIFGVQCTFFEREIKKENFWENPVSFDLDEIVKRGYIRAVVDNSSTSYYIYRGRRMGYEFEMLRNLASSLGVRLHLIVKSDINEAFYLLNRGKADIIAMNLEVTEERKQYAAFTEPLGQMGTVLVQKNRNSRVTDFKDLDNKIIHIRKDAVYKAQLCALQKEQGISLAIIEEKGDSEYFVNKVVKNEIDFTVVDRVVGLVNATYYEDLDVSLEVSPKSDVAWAVRTNALDLQSTINDWLAQKNKTGYINMLYAKYFQNSKNSYFRSNSPFSSVGGNNISPFDGLIQKGAESLGWDWRLLASLVYKESRFDTTATSYAGAVGLLQLMPVTLERFGVEDPHDPLQSLMGGVNYLRYLDKFWRERIPETNERIKVILASYNIGHGHVEDAWKLAIKYGKNPQNWESIAHFLKLKSDPEYYKDPVVNLGFAKGHLAVNYVDDIMILYDSYRVLIEP